MSTLSSLISGYTGGSVIRRKGHVKKENDCIDSKGRPTVVGAYSVKYLRLWYGKDWKKVMKDVRERQGLYIPKANPNNLPTYMNPEYHQRFEVPKHHYV